MHTRACTLPLSLSRASTKDVNHGLDRHLRIESDNTHVCRSLKEIRKKLEQNARLKLIMDNPSAPESERIQVSRTHSHTHGHTYIHFACVCFSYVCVHSCIYACFHLYMMCARTYTCTYVCMHLCRCAGDESRTCFHLYMMCARTYTCTYVCMHLCRCVGDESRTYVCIYVCRRYVRWYACAYACLQASVTLCWRRISAHIFACMYAVGMYVHKHS